MLFRLLYLNLSNINVLGNEVGVESVFLVDVKRFPRNFLVLFRKVRSNFLLKFYTRMRDCERGKQVKRDTCYQG